jgi:Tfp pilus assembly protein PilN
VSQVNLLPPEIRQRQQTRRVTFLVIAGGAIALLLIMFVYLLQVRSLASVNDRVDAQQAINAGLNGQIADLQRFQGLQDEANAKKALLSTVFANEVSLSGALFDVSRVIPSDAYLTSLSISVTPPVAPTPGQTPTGIIGSITFAGQGLDADTVATLLTRLDGVKGWVNPFVTSVTKAGTGSVVAFTGTVDLTTAALTPRGAGQTGGVG